MDAVNRFHAADYAVFGLFITFTISIAAFFSIQARRRKRTNDDFMTAGRDFHVFPVTVSMIVSMMSATSMLGMPTEVYMDGLRYYLFILGMIIGIVVAYFLFIPVLHPLKLTSAVEYLELRFQSKAVRMCGSGIFILWSISYTSVAIYSPSTALAAVTGFPTWASAILVGAVGSVTALGGLRSVIWTDLLQACLMLVGLLCAILQCWLDVGFAEVWQLNKQGGRLNFFELDPDPTVRHSLWSVIGGLSFSGIGYFAVNQMAVQRFASVATLAQAKRVLLLNIPLWIIPITLMALLGMGLYAFFAELGCDPYRSGQIGNVSQLVPYFVLNFMHYPGVPGLFVASLFSGALSSVSSAESSMATVTWEDLLKPRFSEVREWKKTLISRILVLFYGTMCVCFCFVIMQLKGTVMQIVMTVTGIMLGPLLGMFVLGLFFPFINWKGALIGAVVGIAIGTWICVGAIVDKVRPQYLPTDTSGCLTLDNMTSSVGNVTTMSVTNFSMVVTGFTETIYEHVKIQSQTSTSNYNEQVNMHPGGVHQLYRMSYLYYTSLSTVVTVMFGIIGNLITGFSNRKEVDDVYLHPLVRSNCGCMCRTKCWRNCKTRRETTHVHRDCVATNDEDQPWLMTRL